jgi:competence protein ComFB
MMAEIGMKNYMEDLVADMLPAVLNRMNVCQCDRCKYDIMAYVLNKMPPKYVVTRKGQLYTKLYAFQQQFEVDVVAAITTGAAIVSAHPRHDEPVDL